MSTSDLATTITAHVIVAQLLRLAAQAETTAKDTPEMEPNHADLRKFYGDPS